MKKKAKKKVSTAPKKKKTYATYESHTFLGTVVKVLDENKEEKKKIQIDHPIYYNHFVQSICKFGDKVSLVITNRRPKRSDAQNRYMHVYFALISESSGHTPAEIKSWAKGKFLTKGITEVYGSKVRIVNDTHDLNISEMCEFLNEVAEDTTVPLPDPAPFNLPMTFDEYRRLREIQKVEYRGYNAKITYEKNPTKTVAKKTKKRASK